MEFNRSKLLSPFQLLQHIPRVLIRSTHFFFHHLAAKALATPALARRHLYTATASLRSLTSEYYYYYHPYYNFYYNHRFYHHYLLLPLPKCIKPAMLKIDRCTSERTKLKK